MKIVLNKCYGGFHLSEETCEKLGCDGYKVDRKDPALVELVEIDESGASGRYSELRVVEIPDKTTDWEINDYDGFESVTYVMNGKLFHA